MFQAIPMKLTEKSGNLGRATISTESHPVSLHFLQSAEVGDNILVHAGCALYSYGTTQPQSAARQTNFTDLLKKIESLAVEKPLRIMLLSAIHASVLHDENVRYKITPRIQFEYGPGCSLCTTPARFFQNLADISRDPQTIVVSFKEMVNFPIPGENLFTLREQGYDIRTVRSVLDVLRIAEMNPSMDVIFATTGFETMLACVAVMIHEAISQKITNISFYLSLKNSLAPFQNFMNTSAGTLDGIILPAQPALITGWNPVGTIAEKLNIPFVLTDFEARNILKALLKILEREEGKKKRVDIACRYTLTPGGSSAAKNIIDRYFEKTATFWPVGGTLPEGGYVLRDQFSMLDATRRFDIPEDTVIGLPGCSVHQLLSGEKIPSECTLFGSACTPDHPMGPGMLAQDGLCNTWYHHSFRYMKTSS
jgi:hydrogenase expression/formation protein HypD